MIQKLLFFFSFKLRVFGGSGSCCCLSLRFPAHFWGAYLEGQILPLGAMGGTEHEAAALGLFQFNKWRS